MRHVRSDAGVRQQIGEPPIAEGGFEYCLHRLLAWQLAEDPPHLLRPTPNPTATHQLASIVHHCQL